MILENFLPPKILPGHFYEIVWPFQVNSSLGTCQMAVKTAWPYAPPRPCQGGGPTSPVWILECLVSVFINACRLLSALPSLWQFSWGRLSLVAILFYTLSLLFGPCHLSEFTLAGPHLRWGWPLNTNNGNQRSLLLGIVRPAGKISVRVYIFYIRGQLPAARNAFFLDHQYSCHEVTCNQQ